MNDDGRIGELQAAVADQSAKQVLDLEQAHEWVRACGAWAGAVTGASHPSNRAQEKGGNALHFEVMRCGEDLELLNKLLGVGVSPDHQDVR